jgi:cardiolipin synthase C
MRMGGDSNGAAGRAAFHDRATCLRALQAWTLLAMLLLAGCAQLPSLQGRSVSVALRDTADTRLGRAIEPQRRDHPGLSGIVPLVQGHDAFAARAALADAAQRSLDLQYYIWHDDLSGALLFDAVRRAADRGVRVRLLLDDNDTAGIEPALVALDAHPNIEVRLFNPFRHRGLRLLDYLFDLDRANRRMHNKSFTADNQATIVGGRNIGDEYFDARSGVLFVDLDVLAIGPVVAQVSADFDRYWSSDSAYPLDRLLPRPAQGAAGALAPPDASLVEAYRDAIARSTYVRNLQAHRLPIQWARVDMVSDDPGKALGRSPRSDFLWDRLLQLMPLARTEFKLVSPYFVPTRAGEAFFAELARGGVAVSVLTNSLEATDVPAVHAGYARWRVPLLEAGVRLDELKAAAAPPDVRDRRLAGSSSASLHAKTFVIDREHVFVGSLNFDPRSAALNTELGFLIHSPVLGAAVAVGIERRARTSAYRVQLVDGRLQWVQQGPGGATVFTSEPNAGLVRRLEAGVLSWLPIDWLL